MANGLKALGVKKGTPVGIYMGMGPGLPVAMLACARLGAPHTVVFGGFSADSLAGRINDMKCEVLITQDEGWRRGQTVPLKANVDEALESCPTVKTVVVGQRTMGEVPMVEGRDITWRELTDGQSSDPRHVPVRADGRRGPALPPLHERHDRQAQGHRAHDGRLPRRRRHDAPLHLRPQGRGRRLLVRRRHRLGHRAQLHRLRAALQRRDERPLRGHARLPRPRPLVGHRRALRRDDPLHGADGHPRAHEVGPGARAEARPLVPAAARLGRRADQPRGVDVVPRAHRRRDAARSSTRGGRRRRG